MAETNGNGKNGTLTAVVWSVLLPLVTTGIGFLTFTGQQRDGQAAQLERVKTELRGEMNERLSHMTSKEDFLEYRRAENVKSEARYYDLIRRIDRLTDLVSRGRGG